MEVARTFLGHQVEIFHESGSLADYLWKSPDFINQEIEVERKKLWAYFPDEGDDENRAWNAKLRSKRTELEAKKLYIDFPIFISNANLFITSSWYEKHLLAISRLHEARGFGPISEAKGQGVSRYLNYLKKSGLAIDLIEFSEQVRSIVTIRNALLHASGNITMSKDRIELERIISKRIFVDALRRNDRQGMVDEQGKSEIAINDFDVIEINRYFPMLALKYFKEFLYTLCEQVQRTH